MTDIFIRRERPADYRTTEELMREAFWDRYTPGCCEHYLMHVLRSSPAFVPSLTFVAVADGRIAGAVAVAASHIAADDGRRLDTLTIGPIGVRPQLWGRGIGRSLLERVRREAAAGGHRAILLCGDPCFYGKAGYRPAEDFDIRTADDFYADALQACPLHPGALDTAAGRYVEDDIYDVDPHLAETFDRSFPIRRRTTGNASQQRFNELCAMRRHHHDPRPGDGSGH